MATSILQTFMTLGSVAVMGLMVFLNLNEEAPPVPTTIPTIAPILVGGTSKKKQPVVSQDSESDSDDYFSNSDIEL